MMYQTLKSKISVATLALGLAGIVGCGPSDAQLEKARQQSEHHNQLVAADMLKKHDDACDCYADDHPVLKDKNALKLAYNSLEEFFSTTKELLDPDFYKYGPKRRMRDFRRAVGYIDFMDDFDAHQKHVDDPFCAMKKYRAQVSEFVMFKSDNYKKSVRDYVVAKYKSNPRIDSSISSGVSNMRKLMSERSNWYSQFFKKSNPEDNEQFKKSLARFKREELSDLFAYAFIFDMENKSNEKVEYDGVGTVKDMGHEEKANGEKKEMRLFTTMRVLAAVKPKDVDVPDTRWMTFRIGEEIMGTSRVDFGEVAERNLWEYTASFNPDTEVLRVHSRDLVGHWSLAEQRAREKAVREKRERGVRDKYQKKQEKLFADWLRDTGDAWGDAAETDNATKQELILKKWWYETERANKKSEKLYEKMNDELEE